MNNDERTDAALLAATAAGDHAAFAVLVRRYIRTATLLAAQFLGNGNDAEDVVQDAFTVVYRTKHKFDTERPFGPWLFGIIRRLAANRRSRDMRRARLSLLWGWATDRDPASSLAEKPLVAHLDAAVAKRAMATLSPMQRACFDLVAIRGVSTKEVAAMHGISESTVRQHVFRARGALRDLLEGNEGERNDDL